MKFAPLNLTSEDVTAYTPLWQGERSADGRPRVPDDVLARMRAVTDTHLPPLLSRRVTAASFRSGAWRRTISTFAHLSGGESVWLSGWWQRFRQWR